jgi:hypothetical protein
MPPATSGRYLTKEQYAGLVTGPVAQRRRKNSPNLEKNQRFVNFHGGTFERLDFINK